MMYENMMQEKQKNTSMLSDWKSFLGVFLGTLIIVFSLVYVNVAKEFTVVHFSEAVQTNSPEVYKIEISPKVAFAIRMNQQPVTFAIGLIFLAAAFVWIYVAGKESIDFGRWKVYKHSNMIWWGLCLLAAAFLFFPYGEILTNNFINLSSEQYLNIKGDTKVESFYSSEIEEMFRNKLIIR